MNGKRSSEPTRRPPLGGATGSSPRKRTATASASGGASPRKPKGTPRTGTRVYAGSKPPARATGSGRPPGRGGNGPGKGGGNGRGKKPRKGWSFKRLLKIGFIAGMVLVIVMALGFVFAYNMTTVPSANTAFQTQTTKVFYRSGKAELGTFVDQNRESIAYDEIPKHVRDAVVAAEDRTFWTNRGIDPKGILRAAFSNVRGNSTQGASTITQQYVKILYLTSQRTLSRKAKEAFISLKLQRQQSKQEILTGYLNTIYFGRGAYGIQAAAQTYFRRNAKDLSVAQGAFLAAILNSPENLDPANGASAKQALLGRYKYVLGGMASAGTLDATEADKDAQALPDLPPEQKTQKYGQQRGFMLEMVREELKNQLHFTDAEINGGGLRVTTTFSKRAMKAVRDGVLSQKPPGLKGLHIGAVSLDVKTGAVRGIYGGQDYLKSPYNWALKGAQPGSSFKPFALAAGLKQGFSLKDTFDGNSPYKFPDGSEVKNEGGGNGNSYGSAISLTKATEESVNTAYMDLTQSMDKGPKSIVDTARDMGIPIDKTAIKPTAGVSLGTERVGAVDMANAYATIANKGNEHPWFVVEKVVRASDDKTLYTAKHQNKRALPEDIDADVSYALQQVVASGTGTAAQAINRPAAGKTGTATSVDKSGYQYVSSAWFVGYTPQLATAVMYVRGDGNDRLDGFLPSYFGGSYPTRTWAAIMGAELDGVPVEDFPPPANVDGEAPTTGHAPYVAPPPPPPAPAPQPKPKPKPKPSPTPTQAPAPSPTPPPPPSPSPSPSPTPPLPSPSGRRQ